MKLVYTDRFYAHFNFWKKNNAKMVEKIIRLIHAIQENPFAGIGKPEPLCHSLKNCWSRRINKEHRLVYKVEEETIILLACRFHYDQ